MVIRRARLVVIDYLVPDTVSVWICLTDARPSFSSSTKSNAPSVVCISVDGRSLPTIHRPWRRYVHRIGPPSATTAISRCQSTSWSTTGRSSCVGLAHRGPAQQSVQVHHRTSGDALRRAGRLPGEAEDAGHKAQSSWSMWSHGPVGWEVAWMLSVRSSAESSWSCCSIWWSSISTKRNLGALARPAGSRTPPFQSSH